MNLIADQDRILQLVENENDSPQVPRRDVESEHQEGRKEYTEKYARKILDIRKRTRTRQENQAERMLKRRRCELQPGEVGDSVSLPFPLLTGDTEMQGTSLFIGVITQRDKKDFYKVCCEVAFLAISLTCVKTNVLTCVILINAGCCRSERLFQWVHWDGDRGS